MFRAASGAVALALLCLAARAEAHAILVDSFPASGTTVDGPHVALELHFNSRIDKGLSVLELIDPHHVSQKLAQDLGGDDGTLKAGLDLEPGAYVVRWQVTAVDGHITRGTVPFAVKPR
jgi:methionine-rich copper-binding protein CopC